MYSHQIKHTRAKTNSMCMYLTKQQKEQIQISY